MARSRSFHDTAPGRFSFTARAEALGGLPIRSAVLDGELVLLNADGTANFYELMAEMRTRRPDESRRRYYVFDLVHADGCVAKALSNGRCRHYSLSSGPRI
jgi:ATP-dependent DNA ligase